jgi:para-nitrobenzyl esterase
MQNPVFGDMNFRSNGMSEDCLYLNVWTPDLSSDAQLPVLVYFYGGGFIAGDGSEPRYDGEQMARRDIVTITVNYRLNIFGFFAHPELSAESPHQCSGNYGFLDQHAALLWVRDNIAQFGGDPNHITIAGESAGSMSVNAQMVSPLSKDLIVGAIGSSGGLLSLPPIAMSEAEQMWSDFVAQHGMTSLDALRDVPAETLLELIGDMGAREFPCVVDGYFFPKSPFDSVFDGAQIPLMIGWNSEELPYVALLEDKAPTPENYVAVIQALYGQHADEILALYPGDTQAQVEQSAMELVCDRFVVRSTWQWADDHGKTGNPVFRYFYAHPRPPMVPEMGGAVAGLAGGIIDNPDDADKVNTIPPTKGAVHSADIEYAMGNLSTNTVYAWTDDDYQISEMMQAYYANFIKTGNPNGAGLPTWSTAYEGADVQYMVWDKVPHMQVDEHRERYLLHDRLSKKG